MQHDLPALPVIPPPSAGAITLALIGGTHLNRALFDRGLFSGQFQVETPEGLSPRFFVGEHAGKRFLYTHFHGEERWLPTWLALRELGVTIALTGASAGGVHPAFAPPDIVVVDDFLDQNVDRPIRIPLQYVNDADPAQIWPRMVPPVDAGLHACLVRLSRARVRPDRTLDDVNVHPVGVVAQARGGRFETAAEVRHLRQMGADIVTLNVATEMVYARQLGIRLACLCCVANPAEGTAAWGWEELEAAVQRINPVCADILLAAVAELA